MKKAQTEYQVNLIGEQDLSKLTKSELDLLVQYYLQGLKKSLTLSDENKDK